VLGGALGVAVAGLPDAGGGGVIVAEAPATTATTTNTVPPTTSAPAPPSADASTTAAATSSSQPSTTRATTPATTTPATTGPVTTVPPPTSTRAPGDVSVFVANGTQSPALARRTADGLIDKGWERAAVGDTSEPADRTRLYVTTGYEAEATRLVADLPISDVEIVPGPAPDVDAGSAPLVLVLGPDAVDAVPE